MSEKSYNKTNISTPTVLNMTDSIHSRFDNMDVYYDQLVSKADLDFYVSTYRTWLLNNASSVLERIGYDPRLPLTAQHKCIRAYFDTLELYGVTPDAEEYLTTRSWFMNGTKSALLLLVVALSHKGQYVMPTAGNFPEDLCYILKA